MQVRIGTVLSQVLTALRLQVYIHGSMSSF